MELDKKSKALALLLLAQVHSVQLVTCMYWFAKPTLCQSSTSNTTQTISGNKTRDSDRHKNCHIQDLSIPVSEFHNAARWSVYFYRLCRTIYRPRSSMRICDEKHAKSCCNKRFYKGRRVDKESRAKLVTRV